MTRSRKPRYVVRTAVACIPVGKVVYLVDEYDIDHMTCAVVAFLECGRGVRREINKAFLEAWPYDELDAD